MRRPPLGPGGAAAVLALGVLAALKALALVLLAEAVARGVVGVLADSPDAWRRALALGVGAGLLRAATTWAGQYVAVRAAGEAKRGLRRELARRVLAGGGHDVGATTVVGTVGLDALDDYYARVLPAAVTAATVPLLVGLRILSADWVSALIVVLTVPLVPLFMALVGLHTQDRVDESSAVLQRLSHHLVELARGLPVLVGLGRVQEQAAALREVSERHRETTLVTLRTAFLSSLVLELISTLSVAVVAVFVGVRLVHGDLDLLTGLVALLLAPECFAPFRDLGAAFHASQDGRAALRRADEIVAEPVPADVRRAGPAPSGPPALRICGLSVHHPGRPVPALSGVDVELPGGSVLSVEGPSGSGKSTLLGVLAGTVPAGSGSVEGVDPAAVAWVPQHVHTVAGTVLDEVLLHTEDETAARDALARVGLTRLCGADPDRLSPGELRRLGLARGLARVAAGARLLLLDEPTAHLDPAGARRVEALVDELRGRVTVVLASHETEVTALADQQLLLGAAAVPRAEGGPDLSPAPETAVPSGADGALPAPGTAPPVASGDGPYEALRELAAFLAPAPWRTAGAVALGTAAALFAAGLTTLSGWLIVRASQQPGIMYLMVAIVGVRFFGIGRAVLRYAERLVGHDAVLASTTELRARVWAGLAVRGVASRSLATGGAALDHLVATADRVRDLVPRVVLPPLIGAGTAAGAGIAVAALHPGALPALAVALVGGLLVGPLLALLADRSAARGATVLRSGVLRRFAAMVAAADELRANGRAAAMLSELEVLERDAERAARRSAWALGLGSATAVLACSVSSVLMLAATADPAREGALAGPVVAALVLLPLGLLEPMLGAVDAVQQWPALSASLRKLRPLTEAARAAAGDGSGLPDGTDPAPVPVHDLALHGLAVAWPGAPAPAFRGLEASVRRGQWLVVEGPSGAGKSTLLAALLGHLPAAEGRWSVDGVDSRELDAAGLRRSVAWCPQEAHLFDSTLRGNLLLARGREDRPSDAELRAALERVGLGPFLAELPEGLGTRVGPGGAHLSGGQRQRVAVARALLTRADMVLLDEPTAHLDAPAARSLLADLRQGLADRVVVLVTHHLADGAAATDARLRLPGAHPEWTAASAVPVAC
ncbi:thiol reductant ABC exporter subunit CydD [Kocuria sediminis]|uniref:Thiol reductant ABC exporter subunit CydD n=1 Tax=Kocuria sediminis TaxID=1038857 RepID=A0A6N8GK54_9MICC|nr:thiol reductant ABC exporter subunit CydD [Kocuria sediminis]MUN63109.1 thiol reductant ABC exporter subunit CydD [Kocuria sediminis]